MLSPSNVIHVKSKTHRKGLPIPGRPFRVVFGLCFRFGGNPSFKKRRLAILDCTLYENRKIKTALPKQSR